MAKIKAQFFISAIVLVFVAGCEQEQKDDLAVFIAKVKAKQDIDIEPMPAIALYEKFFYSAEELRSPFEKTVIDRPEIEAKERVGNGIYHNKKRLKEELELYPLAELILVGTLERKGDIWALIQAPEGAIHRVMKGNYIGKNNGQIVTLTDTGLTLKEVVSNGDNTFLERQTSLSTVVAE